MAYAAWSVVFGEQPTASKWNILGTNDASFADGTGIANMSMSTTSVSLPYKFSVYFNGSQNVTTSVAKINIDSETFDTNNNFDSSTNRRYVAPVAGFYYFSGAVAAFVTNNAFVHVKLYKNGSLVKNGNWPYNNTGGAQNIYGTVEGLIQLAATDYVELWAIASGTFTILGGATNTFLDGFLVSRT